MMVTLKCMAASAFWKNNTPEIEISVKYNVYTQSMAAIALLKKFLIHWGLVGHNYFCKTKKHCTEKTIPFD